MTDDCEGVTERSTDWARLRPKGAAVMCDKRLLLSATALAAALLVGGCGDDEEPGSSEQDEPTPATEPDDTDVDDAAEEGDNGAEDEGGGADAAEETYVVEDGDTLSSIAQGNDTTVSELVDANDLDDPDVLEVDQELVIP